MFYFIFVAFSNKKKAHMLKTRYLSYRHFLRLFRLLKKVKIVSLLNFRESMDKHIYSDRSKTTDKAYTSYHRWQVACTYACLFACFLACLLLNFVRTQLYAFFRPKNHVYIFQISHKMHVFSFLKDPRISEF